MSFQLPGVVVLEKSEMRTQRRFPDLGIGLLDSLLSHSTHA